MNLKNNLMALVPYSLALSFQELIEDIVEQSQFIFTLQDLTKTSPVFSLRHAIAVLEVFTEMFQDILGLEDLVTLLGQEFLLEPTNLHIFQVFLMICLIQILLLMNWTF